MCMLMVAYVCGGGGVVMVIVVMMVMVIVVMTDGRHYAVHLACLAMVTRGTLTMKI